MAGERRHCPVELWRIFWYGIIHCLHFGYPWLSFSWNRRKVACVLAKILLIDDEKALVEQLSRFLSTKGYECEQVSNGKDGWKRIQQGGLDAIIMDVMLPGLSGFEICRRIRADEELCAMPVILMSCMSDPEEIQHGLAQGADDFIAKPFRLDTLISRIEHMLSTNSLSNQLYDEQTQMPGAKGIKMEVQKRISQKQAFAVAYVEILGLNNLAKQVGPEARLKAMDFLARGLKACGKKLDSKAFYLGHMGGGHFCVLMDTDDIDRFTACYERFWKRYELEFYSHVGTKPPTNNGNQAANRYEPMCCLALCTGAANQSFRELFETLSHVRANAQSTPGGGVYHDRRGFNELRKYQASSDAAPKSSD